MSKFFWSLTLLIISPALAAQLDIVASFEQIDAQIKKGELSSAKHTIDSLVNLIQPKTDQALYLKSVAKSMEIRYKLGDYSSAVKAGENLLTNHEEVIGSDKKYSVEFYMNLGYSYHLTQSNNDKGISYLNQSLSLYQELPERDSELEAKILRYQAGGYYYKGDYETSIAKLKKCLKLLNPMDRTTIAICYRSIGNSYWGMRDYQRAADYYDKGLEILFSNNPIDSLTIGQVLHAKGYIHMDKKDFETAYETFRQASELLAKSKPAVSSPMVWVYGDVGRSMIELKKYDSSLIWLQKAVNANVYEYDQNDYYQNPPLVNINDDFQHFMILKLKGEVFLKKYLISKEQQDLDALLDCFLLADKQIDNIRLTIPKAEDQSTISYYSTELYSKAIDAMVTVHELKPENRFLELAHYFMEKRKITRVHLKFLEASAKSSNILPAEVLNQDQELINQISSLKTKLRKLQSVKSDSVSILKQLLFEAQERYESFIAELKRSHPSYHSSRFDLKVKSADSIGQFLKDHYPNRAIVTYYNFGKKLRISVLTSDTITVHVIRHDLALNKLAEDFRKTLINIESEKVENDTLNELLIQSIKPVLKKNIEEITFILDPALQLIPIELMRLDGSYLFERFDISYHFSGTLFASDNNQKSFGNSFVGFAPSFDSLSMLSLPGAREEVSNASAVFGGSTYMEDDADEATFKERGEKSDFIHLATHAIVDDQNPESSYLQFSSGNNSEDGRLYFFEIYNLNLSAQLVTLSACNTGFGKVQRGEGVMSLSRAFAYAGVPATVVSLWPASDKSTPELMKYFYQNLKDGQAKDEALNNARKQYLATAEGKARHLFYWGGFVLIGDNDPIENTNLLVYLIPSILVIVLILTVYRRKKALNTFKKS